MIREGTTSLGRQPEVDAPPKPDVFQRVGQYATTSSRWWLTHLATAGYSRGRLRIRKGTEGAETCFRGTDAYPQPTPIAAPCMTSVLLENC